MIPTPEPPKVANFATQIFRLPGSFASQGSRDLPHREGLGVLGVAIDPLAGVGDGDREALVLEGEEIHRLFVLREFHILVRGYLKELYSRLTNTPCKHLLAVVCNGQVQLKARRASILAGHFTEGTLKPIWQFIHNITAEIVE